MTLNLFKHFMPREESFTALFCEQTRCIVAAAQELRRMINTGGSNDIHVTTIRSLELEADEIAKKVFIAANRTFNAPIDREDILALAHDLDDAVDLIEDTAKGIQRYGVREFPVQMCAMADAVVQSAEVLQEVVPLLDAITQEHKTIFSLCQKIGRIEGEADECFDAGLAHLRVQLRGGEIDTIAYIDRKELYELLEEVVDKCDDVANALQSVTAKHV
jgi:predicted phosphate transport protein (TIGR00153 family)